MFKISLIFMLMVFALQGVYAEDADIERFTVTGSHIKGLDQEGTTPVTTIDREKLDFSGAGSLGEVIRSLSFASFGVTKKSALSDGNGTASTSFRGLPSGYILIMLNGKRVSNSDLNLIPLSAIEKVEILKDGASATYGSDAVGGVMNFITKRGDVEETFSIGVYLPEPFVLPEKALKFQGWRSEGWSRVPKFQDNIFGLKGGEELRAEYVNGWTGDNHETLFGVTARMQMGIDLQDRPFGAVTIADLKTAFSRYGSPGSYKLTGSDLFQPMPGCPEELVDGIGNEIPSGSGNFSDGFVCRFNYTPHMQLAPTVYTVNSFLTSNTDLDADNVLYSHALYTFEYSKGVLAPPPQPLKKSNFVKSKGVVDPQRVQLWDNWARRALSEVQISGEGLDSIYYRTVHEKGAGQRIQNVFKNIISLQSELETYVSDTWSVNTALNGNGYLELGRNRNYSQVTKLLELNEDGSTKWNPLRVEAEKDDVTYARYEPESYIHHLVGLLEVSANGELLPLGDLGVLSSAVGGRGGYEHWKGSVDKTTWDPETLVTDQWGGGSYAIGGGGRYWGSIFGELVLPVSFNRQNTLEVQLAGSVDYYQYAGFAHSIYNFNDEEFKLPFNPKISAKWKIMDSINIRGSWGTGFKAPTIDFVHMERVLNHPGALDWGQCQADSKKECIKEKLISEQYEVAIWGNEDLKPETSNFWNIGVTLEPANNVVFSVDYFSNLIRDRIVKNIADVDLSSILEAERFLDAQTFAEFKKKHSIIAINRRENGSFEDAEFKLHNFANYVAQGLDLGLSLQVPFMSRHTVFFDTHATYFVSIKEKRPYLDEDFIEKLGTWGYPAYKVLFQLGLQYKNGLKWALTSHWVDGFNDDNTKAPPPAPHQKIASLFKSEEEGFTKACFSQEECKTKIESVSTYNNSVEDPKKKKNYVRQVPDHITFDLNINAPLSVFNNSWSSKSSVLFRLENIFNSMPPEHRNTGVNNQNASGLSSLGSGFIPNGMYSGVNGRAWQVRYSHKF